MCRSLLDANVVTIRLWSEEPAERHGGQKSNQFQQSFGLTGNLLYISVRTVSTSWVRETAADDM